MLGLESLVYRVLPPFALPYNHLHMPSSWTVIFIETHGIEFQAQPSSRHSSHAAGAPCLHTCEAEEQACV